MFIVSGANDHGGSAAASTLLKAGHPVTPVLHSGDSDHPGGGNRDVKADFATDSDKSGRLILSRQLASGGGIL